MGKEYEYYKNIESGNLSKGIEVRVKDGNIKYYIKHKLLDVIELDYKNYLYHIKRKHKDMEVHLIFEILNNPDFIFKTGKNTKNRYYFEKTINGQNYRIVIVKEDKKKLIKTAYKVEEEKEFTIKHAYCSYNREQREFYKEEEKIKRKEDIEYFKKIFNVV